MRHIFRILALVWLVMAWAVPVAAQHADSVAPRPSTAEYILGTTGSLVGIAAGAIAGVTLAECDLVYGPCPGFLPGIIVGSILGSAAGVGLGAYMGQRPYSRTGAVLGASVPLLATALVSYGLYELDASGWSLVVLLPLPVLQGRFAAQQSLARASRRSAVVPALP